MRTSPARTCSHPRRPAAFTLIELMLVVVLMGVIMLLALPAFQSMLQSPLEQEVGRLAGVIRLMRNEAVLTRSTYRLMLDLKRARYFVERQDLEGRYTEVTDPRVFAPHDLPRSLEVDNLSLLGRVYKTDETDPLPVLVDASGYMDPFLLRLTYGDEAYTLRVAGFTGRVDLVKGHVDR